VDITVRMRTKCSAPVMDRKHPATFWRSLTILMSRSAWLLSKGTVKCLAPGLMEVLDSPKMEED
jgi:hypothetical protein